MFDILGMAATVTFGTCLYAGWRAGHPGNPSSLLARSRRWHTAGLAAAYAGLWLELPDPGWTSLVDVGYVGLALVLTHRVTRQLQARQKLEQAPSTRQLKEH